MDKNKSLYILSCKRTFLRKFKRMTSFLHYCMDLYGTMEIQCVMKVLSPMSHVVSAEIQLRCQFICELGGNERCKQQTQ